MSGDNNNNGDNDKELKLGQPADGDHDTPSSKKHSEIVLEELLEEERRNSIQLKSEITVKSILNKIPSFIALLLWPWGKAKAGVSLKISSVVLYLAIGSSFLNFFVLPNCNGSDGTDVAYQDRETNDASTANIEVPTDPPTDNDKPDRIRGIPPPQMTLDTLNIYPIGLPIEKVNSVFFTKNFLLISENKQRLAHTQLTGKYYTVDVQTGRRIGDVFKFKIYPLKLVFDEDVMTLHSRSSDKLLYVPLDHSSQYGVQSDFYDIEDDSFIIGDDVIDIEIDGSLGPFQWYELDRGILFIRTRKVGPSSTGTLQFVNEMSLISTDRKRVTSNVVDYTSTECVGHEAYSCQDSIIFLGEDSTNAFWIVERNNDHSTGSTTLFLRRCRIEPDGIICSESPSHSLQLETDNVFHFSNVDFISHLKPETWYSSKTFSPRIFRTNQPIFLASNNDNMPGAKIIVPSKSLEKFITYDPDEMDNLFKSIMEKAQLRLPRSPILYFYQYDQSTYIVCQDAINAGGRNLLIKIDSKKKPLNIEFLAYLPDNIKQFIFDDINRQLFLLSSSGKMFITTMP